MASIGPPAAGSNDCTASFTIPARHHRTTAESSGNIRVRPLCSSKGIRHRFLWSSVFQPVPGLASLFLPRPGSEVAACLR